MRNDYKIDSWESLINKIVRFIVWKFSSRIIYWTLIRAYAHATGTVYTNKHPDEVTFKELCEMYENK